MNHNLGINIAGYINGEFGIGEGVRANIRAIETTNIPFSINNFTRSPNRNQDTTYQNFNQDNPYPINLIQVNADEVNTFIKHSSSSYFQNRYNIGFWAWEIPEFPQKWQPVFDNFHEIWTYSNYCAEAISLVSPIPVIKIMPSIELPPSYLNRQSLNLPENKFIFLFIFDFSSLIERKNPLAAIQAFKQAFGENDRVLLILKSSNSAKNLRDLALLQSAIGNSPNIQHLDGYLSKNEINGLLYNCDCYLSLHRCEGFGLTMAEAMFYGKPVIATGYSSNTEFMNVGNSFLVKYKLIPLDADYGPYKKGNFWAEPDIEHAAYLMRQVFHNHPEAQQVGAIAARDIKNLLSPTTAGKRIQKRLEYIAKITDDFQASNYSETAQVNFIQKSENNLSSSPETTQPLVSICIPTYNGAAFIGEAIESALAQTYPNLEVIISDDGSTDATIAIAQSFTSQTSADLRIILHRNYGLSQNWNFCISQAKGKYIKFLFQDDFLAPECIAKMVAVAEQHPKIGMVFSPRGITIDASESNPILRRASQSINDLHKGWSSLKSIQPGLELLADPNCLNNPINKIGEPTTVLIASRVFAEIGLFDSGLSQYVDLDMWWRIMGNYHIGFVDEKLSSLRIHPEQQTWKNFAAGENHKDVVRFYNKLLNSPEYSFLNQQIKQTIQQKLDVRTQRDLSDLSKLIELYKKSPATESVVSRLRQYRQQIARHWLNLPADKFETAYLGEMGKFHQLLLDSGIKHEILTEEEQGFVQQLGSKLAQGDQIVDKIPCLLAAMLYRDAYQLPFEYRNAAIREWFFEDLMKFLFQSPTYFQQVGEVETYSRYLQDLIDYVAGNIASFPDLQLWRYLAQFVVNNLSLKALYLSEHNLLNVESQRDYIVETYLTNIGCQIDFNFQDIKLATGKIRLGILIDTISGDSDTFAAIPAFEYLDRDKFEIIVYYSQIQAEELGKYCESRVDKFVHLSMDLLSQVEEMRSHNLDILLICTNTTETSKPSSLLSLHRLARLQIAAGGHFSVGHSSVGTRHCRVPTGIRNIDRILVGNLALPPDAPAEYLDRLITLEGSGVCFSYPVPSENPTVKPTRSSWGATDQSVIFISGVTAFKIIPELRATWAKIIAATPNSILVLYPFHSRPKNYPTMPFYHQMRSLFAEFGIDKQRLVMIRALPTRADYQECLKLADIYLDSYPDNSAASLVAPLLAGLPMVVRVGQNVRSQQSAAVLKELQFPELVANSENSYVEMSTALGINPELRRQYRDQVQRKMATNPKFLDSRAYSFQLGTLLQETFFNQF
ncbi:glycosyltransferase [Tychonema sp. BBK16]|uniref:glycosyltransferase n=1 Tax=Tychonema sp. BBK16 TaxID=2699888 RepID=UPI001F45B7C2|nr:glycosyltransferase [Tychonema sp. BBK16]MCF6374179.1 glycosyltransferase [Tychonema sp. BBK16]